MKQTILSVALIIVFATCSKDEQSKSPCEVGGGTLVKSQLGRIYKWTGSEPSFFYIGNPKLVSSGVNGGFIPCNDLPAEFQVEGKGVVYSGLDKGTAHDATDPLFAFISITEIKIPE